MGCEIWDVGYEKKRGYGVLSSRLHVTGCKQQIMLSWLN